MNYVDRYTELNASTSRSELIDIVCRREIEIAQLNGIIQGYQEARAPDADYEPFERVVHDVNGGLEPLYDPECHVPGDVLGPY